MCPVVGSIVLLHGQVVEWRVCLPLLQDRTAAAFHEAAIGLIAGRHAMQQLSCSVLDAMLDAMLAVLHVDLAACIAHDLHHRAVKLSGDWLALCSLTHTCGVYCPAGTAFRSDSSQAGHDARD